MIDEKVFDSLFQLSVSVQDLSRKYGDSISCTVQRVRDSWNLTFAISETPDALKRIEIAAAKIDWMSQQYIPGYFKQMAAHEIIKDIIVGRLTKEIYDGNMGPAISGELQADVFDKLKMYADNIPREKTTADVFEKLMLKDRPLQWACTAVQNTDLMTTLHVALVNSKSEKIQRIR
jgi:hypothetical protein